MFKTEIEELYNYQSKGKPFKKISAIKQDRKSVVLYDFGDVKWILMPKKYPDIKFEDIDLYKKLDPTFIMFRKNDSFNNILHYDKCRLLTEKDRFEFMEFHNACSNIDKEKGLVSLLDPTVYGCYEGNVLVSVASLWNWGDILSDIGVLTHPEYRGKGYSKSVCQSLINGVNRKIIWRCDFNNVPSNILAKRLGFKAAGKIFNLVKRR